MALGSIWQFMDWSVTLKILSGSRQTNIILLQYDKLPHKTLKTPKKKKKKIVSGENLDICNPVLTESTQICNCI
jgi:hypothetical protein